MRKLLLLALLAVATSAGARDKFAEPRPVKLDRGGERWAERTLKKMTPEQKVGQLFMIWARAEYLHVGNPELQRLRDLVAKYHLGGFGLTVNTYGPLLLKSEPLEAAAMLNELQRDAEIPLLIGADFERGVAMRLQGSTPFPHAMAFGAAGDPALAEEFGRITASESRAIGVHWNWFPVADVNSHPGNPIINTRAFGEDPVQVGELVAAYIRGARDEGMLTTAKHFPGHGNVDTDTHVGVATVTGTRAQLDAIELPPFRRAMEAGVDSVMIAHVSVPALESDPNRVASTSHAITTTLLKEELGFKGLVVTDALEMRGVTRLFSGTPAEVSGKVAVEAFKAGSDVLIIPASLEGAYAGVLQAVGSGEISESRLDESVLKILKAKASVGLHKARFVDVAGVNKVVADPAATAAAQRVADAAVTLVRDDRALLPLARTKIGTDALALPYTRVLESRNRVVAVIFTEDVRAEQGRVLEKQLRMRVPDASVIWIDPTLARFSTDAVLATVAKAERVIAAVYAAPAPGRVGRTTGLAEAPAALLRSILEVAGDRTVVVALGSPYLAAEFPQVGSYLCTFSNSTVSEASAVRALFGEIAVGGKLPVTIPNYATRGGGLARPAAAAAGGTR